MDGFVRAHIRASNDDKAGHTGALSPYNCIILIGERVPSDDPPNASPLQVIQKGSS